MQKITIIGAGLSGSLLAILLAERGFSVDLYERRPDMRKEKMVAGRSINLALSNRGINALRLIGLEKEMLQLAIPMFGRMIHVVDQPSTSAAYSGRKGEYINSISRGELNMALLNKAESFDRVTIFFNHQCIGVDMAEKNASFATASGDIIVAYEKLIGTDGAGSALRDAFVKYVPEFSFTQHFLEHGYKELNIPPGPNGTFLLEKNYLHIWPRGTFMCIALPNPTADFTVTLFLSKTGQENSFDQLNDETAVTAFFNRYFPEIASRIPDLAEQFFANPVGNLGTVKCAPYHFNDSCILLGDAAHAVVPFYGQGMNCSFEDVVELDHLLDQFKEDWETVFASYTQQRKPNCDAIADLAVDNFYEMRDATANAVFQRKRQLETKLEQTYPDYFSKYSMVTFREDLPYSFAMEQGRKQDALLMQLCENISGVEELDLDWVFREVKKLGGKE